MDSLIVILGVGGLIAFYVVMIYNRLVALRQTRENAFSDIDVQLKQRFNLIPSLVETVKGYASHEKETFENIAEARSQVGGAGGGAGAKRVKAENVLSGALMGLMAVVENYPDLKADQNFQQLMAELSDIENKISAARRFFNSATNEFNTAVRQFPAVVFAGMLGFSAEEYFEIDEASKEAPEVKFTK